MDADSALKLLLKNRRLFVACYTPVVDETLIDFTTGAINQTMLISFGQGSILTRLELKSFARRSSADNLTMMSSKTAHMVLENPKFAINLKSKFVVNGETYSVSQIHDSLYSKYKLLALEKLAGQDIHQPEVKVFICSDRVRSYLDKLCVSIKEYYSGVIPNDLVVWPVVGFDATSSLRNLFQINTTSTLADVVGYTELGRNSGYITQDIAEVITVHLAKNLTQTNKSEVQGFIDTFNMEMGRL